MAATEDEQQQGSQPVMLGEVMIRCNNVMYIRAASTPNVEDATMTLEQSTTATTAT